jgi:flagellar motor protein MotB
MADPLTDIFASVRLRLQEELDAQLREVSDKHVEAVATARREADLEAEQRWSALLEQARADAQQQADTAREQAVQAPPVQATVEDDSVKTLLRGFGRVASANSLVSALNALAQCASELGESTLLVLAGSQLQPWPHVGTPHAADELTREALTLKSTVRSDTAIAVPLVLDDTVVAVLYGQRRAADAPSSFDGFEALARFGSTHLANLTLLRTAHAQRWIADSTRLFGGGSATDTAGDASEDETTAARRFARLLVSEIKLYNEGAVRVGRERRDLLQRLGEEIDRARRLYEERVPASVPGRAQHFHTELVQTLAGGDPALLG